MNPTDPSEPRQSPAGRRTAPQRMRPGRVIAPLVFLVVLALILKQEIPQLNAFVERMLRPERWEAMQACQRAAIAAAQNRDFARIVSEGEVHTTENGYFVQDVVVGEMSEGGAETVFRFSCYADATGALVRTHRADAPASAP